MHGLKLYITLDDLNDYIHNHINEAYEGHTFIPVKVEIDELSGDLEINLLTTNYIGCSGFRYKLDLNKIQKER